MLGLAITKDINSSHVKINPKASVLNMNCILRDGYRLS